MYLTPEMATVFQRLVDLKNGFDMVNKEKQPGFTLSTLNEAVTTSLAAMN